jgi:hypothetical protein
MRPTRAAFLSITTPSTLTGYCLLCTITPITVTTRAACSSDHYTSILASYCAITPDQSPHEQHTPHSHNTGTLLSFCAITSAVVATAALRRHCCCNRRRRRRRRRLLHGCCRLATAANAALIRSYHHPQLSATAAVHRHCCRLSPLTGHQAAGDQHTKCQQTTRF